MSLRIFLGLYFFTSFLQAGAYGLTFLMPSLFAQLGANEKDVGTVLLVTAITTLIAVVLLRKASSYLGRVNLLSLSCFLIGISLYLLSIIDQYGFISILAGGILGIGWGWFYVLTPIILTDITDKESRVKIFTIFSAFLMAGFGLSPVFGAQLQSFGFDIKFTFFLFALFSLMSGLLFFLLKNPLKNLSLQTTKVEEVPIDWDIIKRIMTSKAIRPIVMVGLGASVFAAVVNFQTSYASQNGFNYQYFFLTYTFTVIICRILFAKFIGGQSPYGIIALLLFVMTCSVLLFTIFASNNYIYIFAALLFGIGYGLAYPIIKAMAANDADNDLMAPTLQFFGLSYFAGLFGFPFIAGWLITHYQIEYALFLALILAICEFILALLRHYQDRRKN